MDPTRYRQFFKSKLELAHFLVSEKGDVVEPDAEILLCCAISGLAYILWPGRFIDRQRFIQLLIEFSTKANLRLISTPVLAYQLRESGCTSSAINLSSRFFPGHPTEVINPSDVDLDETEVTAVVPSLDLKTIRHASYASIIYTDLRCALVHEYELSSHITTFNLLDIHDKPSYINMTFEDGQNERLLHLPFSYLADVLDNVAEALFAYWNNASHWKKPRPLVWWADGGGLMYDQEPNSNVAESNNGCILKPPARVL